MSDLYVLDEKGEARAAGLHEWGEWYETANRTVARDYFPFGWSVSTVFLGIDYRFGEGLPLLFETMTFRPFPHEFDCARDSTQGGAKASHLQACSAVLRRPEIRVLAWIRSLARHAEIIDPFASLWRATW